MMRLSDIQIIQIIQMNFISDIQIIQMNFIYRPFEWRHCSTEKLFGTHYNVQYALKLELLYG